MYRAAGEFAGDINHGVSRTIYSRDTLHDWMMSDADRENADGASSIFASNNPFFEALVVDKRSKSSLRNLGRSAVEQA